MNNAIKIGELIISLLLLFCLNDNLFAQNSNAYNEESVRTQARFRNGGINEFRWYIDSIVKREISIDDKIVGKIVVEFRVDSLGTLTDINIIRNLRYDIDEVVIRALGKSPKWIPAKINNQPVSQRFVIPISFHDFSPSYYDVPKSKKK